MNSYMFFFSVLVFLAVMLMVMGLENLWHMYWGENSANIQRRLRVITGENSVNSQSLVKSRALSNISAVNYLLRKIPRIEQLDIFLTQAGLRMNIGNFLMLMFALVVISFFAAIAYQMDWKIQVIGVCLPPVLWLLWLQRQRNKRVQQIEKQLPDTLDLMARAMQAGHAFSSALLIVGSEGAPPIRNEFQTTFDEINFGISTETALHHLTQRVASSDLRFFVVAVLIQLETGGNLTDILKSLAALIRDRQRIAGTIKVLTAEGRLSAWILGLLPFIVAAILSVVNHEFISKLWTDPIGIRMVQISLSLMVFGIWWMWHMVKVEI